MKTIQGGEWMAILEEERIEGEVIRKQWRGALTVDYQHKVGTTYAVAFFGSSFIACRVIISELREHGVVEWVSDGPVEVSRDAGRASGERCTIFLEG